MLLSNKIQKKQKILTNQPILCIIFCSILYLAKTKIHKDTIFMKSNIINNNILNKK